MVLSPLVVRQPPFLVLWITCGVARVLGACTTLTEFEDQCTVGKMRCNQGVAEACGVLNDKIRPSAQWGAGSSQRCGDPSLCVATSDSEAFCVASAGKHAACNVGDGPACSGDHLFMCKEGYVIYDLDCAKYDGHCASATTAACVGAGASTDPATLCARESAVAELSLCSGDMWVACSGLTATTLPAWETACPQCRLLVPPDPASSAGFYNEPIVMQDTLECGPALGEACTDLCGSPLGRPTVTPYCRANVCTVACTPPSDGGPDPCEALLTDPQNRNNMSVLVTIRSGSCGADGYCVWQR